MKNILLFISEKLSPFNVWIMVGLPGSGKSTWIANNLNDNIEIVNQDAIRVELGIMKDIDHKKIGDRQQEKQVSKINDERIEELILNREDFVIDNTNVKAGRVENYYRRLTKAGANVKIVIIDTPVETCIERRKDDIPKNVIEKMDAGVQKVKDQFGKDKNTIIVKKMINLKELYTNAPELFDKIFENTKITIVGANNKEEVIEKLNDEKTKYIGVRSEFDDHVSLFEYDNTDSKEADELFGTGGNIDDVVETLNATIRDPKILNRAIMIGNKLPIRMTIEEAYDERTHKIMKKYGQGLKNCYDYLVSKTL